MRLLRRGGASHVYETVINVVTLLAGVFWLHYDPVMVTCWASAMGDCSAKQSVEHYVTRGLWSASAIMISGFNWQNGEAKTLPVATLETKILCKSHNERLSEVDAEATRIFRFIGEALETFQHWQKQQPTKKQVFPTR